MRYEQLRNSTVLVVEDDRNLREALIDTLELSGCQTMAADSAEAALALLSEQCPDLIVSDVNMGAMNGLQLLKVVRSRYPQLPMLLITAYGSINDSIEAIRNGAVDYLVKPFKPQQLVEAVSRYLGVAAVDDRDQPVAEDPGSQQLLALARRVAETDSTVLICGESGTGKEVLARYVHQQSPRAKGPFIAINCAAIPENMLEGMLFGHEKGAFTGAYSSSPGKFEQANGGTLLLDEISEMDIGLQAKLLRVIQEREVERLGGRKPIPLDVRIIATTNRQLQQAVQDGQFREDLFYRLSVFPLQWLPLRERRQDIVPIAIKLLQKHAEKMARSPVQFDESAIQALLAHPWPGNVRELENVVQRALIMQPGVVIADCHLRLDPFNLSALTETLLATEKEAASSSETHCKPLGQALGDDLQRREFEIIIETLRREGGSRKQAAEKLGISARTLRYKLARMRDDGINIEQILVHA